MYYEYDVFCSKHSDSNIHNKNKEKDMI